MFNLNLKHLGLNSCSLNVAVEDISKIKSYAEFLDRFVTDEDRMYLEDEELARDVKELYAVNKGEIRSKADFERKKKEIEDLNREEDTKERPLFSLNMTYRKGSFLDQLQERESEVRNGRKSTIIFIRYKDKKGKAIALATGPILIMRITLRIIRAIPMNK